MEKEIIEELMKECNWWERIVVRSFSKTCSKIYNIGRIKTINILLKDL